MAGGWELRVPTPSGRWGALREEACPDSNGPSVLQVSQGDLSETGGLPSGALLSFGEGFPLNLNVSTNQKRMAFLFLHGHREWEDMGRDWVEPQELQFEFCRLCPYHNKALETVVHDNMIFSLVTC